MFRLRAPDHEHLRALLAQQETASLTYEEVGATRDSTLPGGYNHDRHTIFLGQETFGRARDGLRSWQAHLGAGVSVFPPSAPLQVGTDVIVAARAGPLHALAPCRVVYTIDEPGRFGFAYGTLPGHPERGEEAFILENDAEGRAEFRIVAFSRPADLAAKLGSPIARRVQRRVTRAYLDALHHYATGVE